MLLFISGHTLPHCLAATRPETLWPNIIFATGEKAAISDFNILQWKSKLFKTFVQKNTEAQVLYSGSLDDQITRIIHILAYNLPKHVEAHIGVILVTFAFHVDPRNN